ncbi:MAG: transposase [Gammaproteobacteria bacterium]|nr:transposase [Gammaproteobacteria bacterium]MBP9728970.1 transposase [Gammaproteobacteria bacterium]
MRKTFFAHLPKGYQGEFGPNIKALILSLHSDSKMTEPAIVNFLSIHGIRVSAATVSRIITDHHEVFHQEKADIVQAGSPSTIYQQMDDTSARVNGKNNYTHILCNEYYTAYFTRPRKDRLTILEILSQKLLTFCFNESAYALMEQMGLPNKVFEPLKSLESAEIMNRQEIDILLAKLFPEPGKHHKNPHIILEASAIVAYQRLPNAMQLLLTDDAPQFKQITEMLALCWIHDGRHYKKLGPVCPRHIETLEEFLGEYWAFYHQLLDYKQSPTIEVSETLRHAFKLLFSKKTGYDQLDARIQKKFPKEDSLLLVLKYPEVPLHNNASELGARVQARYRDISFQTKNKKGTEAKDTFMTIVATAKKLAVNAFLYIKDRVSQQFEMPALANLVAAHNSS